MGVLWRAWSDGVVAHWVELIALEVEAAISSFTDLGPPQTRFTHSCVCPKLRDFAAVHSTSAQRLFNLLCLAYGSNPKVFAALREMDLLKERAAGCEGEYRQVDYAVRKLIPQIIARLTGP